MRHADPSEGVIVYEVVGKHEVYLVTETALAVGQTFSTDVGGFDVKVLDSSVGGFRISVDTHLGPDDRTVPFVKFMESDFAAGRVQPADLVAAFTGDTEARESWVFTQSPAAGSIVRAGDTVTMQLRKGPVP